MISPQSSINNYGLQIINRHNVITSHKSCNKNPVHENSVNDHSFKLIIMNCQSIVGKKSVLDNLIYQFKPDIIVGTESWLKPTISTNEFFSSSFEVFRRDRPDGYGGVFLACSKDFCWQSIPVKSSCDAKVVACKLELKNSLLIVIGVYRPPNSNLIC